MIKSPLIKLKRLVYSQYMREEKAVAFVELALAIPVLLISLFVIVELGRFFYQYTILSQVANVAVRTGVQINGMFPRCFESREVLNLGYQTDAPGNGELLGHWIAQRRAEVLISHYLSDLTIEGSGPDGQPGLRTEFISDVETSPSSGCASISGIQDLAVRHQDFDNTFAVRIEGRYSPLLLAISIPISIEARSLMLLNNEQFTIYKGVVSGVPWRPSDLTTGSAGSVGSGTLPGGGAGALPGGGVGGLPGGGLGGVGGRP